MSKFNPLRNPRTSRAFFTLLDGPKNLTEIANSLDIQPSSAYEHIQRLKRINIVKSGKRDGKFQAYGINWRIFCHLFLQEAPRSTARRIKMPKRLARNNTFKKLVQEYLCESRMLKNITLLKAINEFEEGLVRIFPLLKDKSYFKEEEILEFLVTLQEWYSSAKDSITLPQNALLTAFEKLKLVESA